MPASRNPRAAGAARVEPRWGVTPLRLRAPSAPRQAVLGRSLGLAHRLSNEDLRPPGDAKREVMEPTSATRTTFACIRTSLVPGFAAAAFAAWKAARSGLSRSVDRGTGRFTTSADRFGGWASGASPAGSRASRPSTLHVGMLLPRPLCRPSLWHPCRLRPEVRAPAAFAGRGDRSAPRREVGVCGARAGAGRQDHRRGSRVTAGR